MTPAKVYYLSDVLCIWAYASQARVEEARRQFGDRIEIDSRFCSVFPDARSKITETWKNRGGFEGFNAHLQEVSTRFPHVRVHERIWLDARPRSSTSAHLFLKAVQVDEEAGTGAPDGAPDSTPDDTAGDTFERACWAVRAAFFEQCRDISDRNVQREIAQDLGLDCNSIDDRIRSSEAMARLDADHKFCELHSVRGSPTFLMNDARQKLYGNVGYRLIEANIQELLRSPGANQASWC